MYSRRYDGNYSILYELKKTYDIEKQGPPRCHESFWTSVKSDHNDPKGPTTEGER